MPKKKTVTPASGKKPEPTKQEIEAAKALLESNGHKVQAVTAGQPTKYDPKYCQLLIEHMSSGLSFESFGAVAKTDRRTLYNWQEAHEEFFHAHKEGELQRLKFYEQLGAAGASGNLPGFSASAWIFTMKNVAKWTDRQDVTSGDAPLPVTPATVTVYIPDNGRSKK